LHVLLHGNGIAGLNAEVFSCFGRLVFLSSYHDLPGQAARHVHGPLAGHRRAGETRAASLTKARAFNLTKTRASQAGCVLLPFMVMSNALANSVAAGNRQVLQV